MTTPRFKSRYERRNKSPVFIMDTKETIAAQSITDMTPKAVQSATKINPSANPVMVCTAVAITTITEK